MYRRINLYIHEGEGRYECASCISLVWPRGGCSLQGLAARYREQKMLLPVVAGRCRIRVRSKGRKTMGKKRAREREREKYKVGVRINVLFTHKQDGGRSAGCSVAVTIHLPI